MSNREIIDYILSNKIKINDVIKEHYYYKDKKEYATYIFYNGLDFYDDNGAVNITRFCDQEPDKSGIIQNKYEYEIISKEEANREIDENIRLERIYRLEKELKTLKGEINE